MLENVTKSQAKWLGDLLSQLSDGQIADAFRAAGYTPEEVEQLARVVRERINQLTNISMSTTAD